MKIAFDTNLLAYAEGVNGAGKQAEALAVIDALPRADVVLPIQALEELFNVLTRKHRWAAQIARARVSEWCDTTTTAETSADGLNAAMDLVIRHKLTVWDALILAAAAEAGCRMVLSEDMQDGFVWRGLTVTNPFAAELSPLLQSVLRP